MSDRAERQTTITLVGFALELPGNESEIAEADPVVQIDGRDFVAIDPSWTSTDLAPLSDAQRRFVHFLSPSQIGPISEGETVWVLGDILADRLDALRVGPVGSDRIERWNVLPGGFRWHLGHHRLFQELNQSMRQRLEAKLHGCLRDPMELSHGHADDIVMAYEAMIVPNDQRRATTLGLYFRETDREYDFDFVQDDAVESGLFASAAEFQNAVNALQNRLGQTKLRDSVAPVVIADESNELAPATRESVEIPDPDVRARETLVALLALRALETSGGSPLPAIAPVQYSLRNWYSHSLSDYVLPTVYGSVESGRASYEALSSALGAVALSEFMDLHNDSPYSRGVRQYLDNARGALFRWRHRHSSPKPIDPADPSRLADRP